MHAIHTTCDISYFISYRINPHLYDAHLEVVLHKNAAYVIIKTSERGSCNGFKSNLNSLRLQGRPHPVHDE